MASTLEDETKDIATRDATSQRAPDRVDNVALAVASGIEEDVHCRSKTMVSSICDNVDIGWQINLEGIDTVAVKLAAVLVLLVQLVESVGVSFLDSIAVTIGVFSLNLHRECLVGTEFLRVAAIAGEHDVERALARDVFAEVIKSLVELIPQQLSRIVLLGVALLVVALAAAVGVPKGPNPLFGTVATMKF